jgi:hypothetical protein
VLNVHTRIQRKRERETERQTERERNQPTNTHTQVRELVELSYNTTVPAMISKYPDVFKEEMLTTNKWAWACAIILSRALAIKHTKGMMSGSYSLAETETLHADAVLATFKDPSKAPPAAVHTLVPVVDMVNHEANDKLRCNLTVKPDGAVVVVAGAGGLARGYEIAVSYSDKLCGTFPINRWGFVLPPCPGTEGDASQTAAEDASKTAQGTPAEGAQSE